MQLKVDFIDNGSLARFKRLHDVVLNERMALGVKRVMLMLSDKIQGSITQGTYGVKTDTGRLRGSFGGNSDGVMFTEEEGTNIVIGTLGSNLKYARIQEYGGTITASKSKYLRFRTRDGAWHSKKSVRIPEHLYLHKTMEKYKSESAEMLKTEIAAAMGSVNGR